jgi:acetyltransferase-like isoleucine patch superfamily enzyme
LSTRSPPIPDPLPDTLELEGEDHEIRIGDGVRLDARILVRGRRNRLIIEHDVTAVAYVSAGFAATAPDPGAGTHTITIDGDDNLVRLGAMTRLGANMTVRGNRNNLEFGERCHLHGFINVLCSDARLSIGERTTMVQGSIQMHEPGEIRLGQDCMVSSQVYISLSDIHPIYDRSTGQRLNPAASVHIGDHVWLGLRCMVMKGAQIGDGGVIAAGAIVSGDTPSYAIVAGVPGRVVRANVEWRRDFSQPPSNDAPLAPTPRPKRTWKWF